MAQLILVSAVGPTEAFRVHVTPPSIVSRIEPVEFAVLPTAKHAVIVGQSIAEGENAVPKDFCVQLLPPSRVLRMKFGPTTKHVVTLGQLMSFAELAVSSYRFAHVLPRSLVLRTTVLYGPRIEK
ncbi:MAG: hypothetical protein E6J53_07110 [Chloroflexi bacterium]|nr:MAG: hypothetical protein E6J53_07110 [Chloroflexota bacterium]